MTAFVLMDIEGTTTPIDFVHRTLFPYARQRLAPFVRAHQQEPRLQALMTATLALAEQEGTPLPPGDHLTQAIALFESYSDADRKVTPLKDLQGMIWREGYTSGELRSELYPDVEPCLRAWHGRGTELGIYSSGSVEAQKLLFAHTPTGDLTPLLSAYFDTGVGAKRTAAAYATILAKLGKPAAQVAFLSDVPEELDAAASQGMVTIQLVRPGTKPSHRHQVAKDFLEVARHLSF